MVFMKLKAIIFDLDGTLVHTVPLYRYIVVGNALETLRVKDMFKRDIDDFWFLGEEERKKIIEDVWKLDPENQFWPAFRIYDTADLRRQHTEAYNDIDIFNFLKEKGIKTGIVTSAPRHILDLELSLLNHKFDSVIRAQLSENVKQKPDKDGLIKCMNQLRVSPDEIIYVGNSIEDMKMARSANVYGVFVDRKEYDFGEVDADLIIPSLSNLRDFF